MTTATTLNTDWQPGMRWDTRDEGSPPPLLVLEALLPGVLGELAWTEVADPERGDGGDLGWHPSWTPEAMRRAERYSAEHGVRTRLALYWWPSTEPRMTYRIVWESRA